MKFHTLGGFDPKTLTAQRVIVDLKDKILKKIKNIVLLSQARSGSTFATHNLSKYLGYKKTDTYPEEYFFNKHFAYIKNFVNFI